VAANPTGPVFNVDFAKELEDIKLKIDEVNQLEKERLDQLTNEKEAAAGAVIQQQLEQGKFSSFLLVGGWVWLRENATAARARQAIGDGWIWFGSADSQCSRRSQQGPIFISSRVQDKLQMMFGF
jgi:hypothetical protein